MKICKYLMVAVPLFLSGCATIVSGTKQSVGICSEPLTATILVDGEEMGETPMQMKLNRSNKHLISLKLEGYKQFDIQLEKKFNCWYAGNILFGALVGFIIDPITGAIYKLEPLKLERNSGNGSTYHMVGEQICIMIQMERDPNLQKIGHLKK
jgi:uncharacterized protein YceK